MDRVHLADLPVAPRYFWTDGFLRLAFEPGVCDRNFDGTSDQKLTPNRTLVLALNELSAHVGRGWFWHLPSRNSSSHEKTEPASRRPCKPGALYPSMVYMDYVWSDAARAGFYARSHQFRLAASDFYLNFPRDDVPLHSFQVVSDRQYAAFAVPRGSHVVLMTPASLHLVPIADYERVAGRWPAGKARPRSADPELRLDNVRALWQDGRDPRCAQLDAYRVSLEQLHRAAVRMVPLCTTQQVRQTIPRPSAPEMAIPLGMALAAVRPSRRGVAKKRKRGEE